MPYSVVGLVGDGGRLIRGYEYDVYGRRREINTHWDLFIGIRNHLGESATGELAKYDVTGDGTIDLRDLTKARIPPELPSYQPWGFQGRIRCSYKTSGASPQTVTVYDFRARFYDPTHGRFMQRDPAEYADSYNLYLAMGGNPLFWGDPTGESYDAFQDDVDALVGDLMAHRMVALEYIAAGARMVEMGMQASLAMMQMYVSMASPVAGLAMSVYDLYEDRSLTNVGGVVLSATGLGGFQGMLARLGPSLGRWGERFAMMSNPGARAVGKKRLDPIHHILPKFLGGWDIAENVTRIPKRAHEFFHAALHDALQARKVPQRLLGGPTGSAKHWEEEFIADPTLRDTAWDALKEAAHYTDSRFGTTLVDQVFELLGRGFFGPVVK